MISKFPLTSPRDEPQSLQNQTSLFKHDKWMFLSLYLLTTWSYSPKQIPQIILKERIISMSFFWVAHFNGCSVWWLGYHVPSLKSASFCTGNCTTSCHQNQLRNSFTPFGGRFEISLGPWLTPLTKVKSPPGKILRASWATEKKICKQLKIA